MSPSGVEINFGAIERLFADPDGPVGQIIEEKTIEVETVAKGLLAIPGSGKTYLAGVITFKSGGKIYSNFDTGGSLPHQASAPGAPPAMETGKLLGSVGHRIGTDGTVYGIVGTPEMYGRYLELGTHREDGTVGLLPRPWLRPALYIVLPS